MDIGLTLRRLTIASFIAIVAGCAKSSSPQAEDLVKVRPPTFNQSLTTSISAPTINFNVRGECDSSAYLTQYSLDEKTWIDIECINSTFTIPVVVNGRITVWARSRGKFSYTPVSQATVRFALPPTSNSIVAVASSRSDSSDRVGRGSQNALGHGLEGSVAASGSKNVQTQVPRIVYDQ